MRITLRAFVLAAAALATTAFVSQSAHAATARVPFQFIANGTTMPAGLYSVTTNSNNLGSIVTLTSLENGHSYMWLLQPGDARPGDSSVLLRFDQANGVFALRSIQYHALITHRIDKHFSEDSATHLVRGY